MHETKQLKRSRSGNGSTDHKDEKDHKKEEPSHGGDRSHHVSHGGPADQLDAELTLMDPLSYYQAGTFLDPGDRALEEFEKPRA